MTHVSLLFNDKINLSQAFLFPYFVLYSYLKNIFSRLQFFSLKEQGQGLANKWRRNIQHFRFKLHNLFFTFLIDIVDLKFKFTVLSMIKFSLLSQLLSLPLSSLSPWFFLSFLP